MTWPPPENWWLLAPAVLCQGLGLIRLAFLSRFGAHSPRTPRWAVALVAMGALFGLAYALLTRDLVFAAGQVGMLLLAWVGSQAS